MSEPAKFVQILKHDGQVAAIDADGDVWVFRAGEVVTDWVSGSSRAAFAWHQLSPARVTNEEIQAKRDAEREENDEALQRQRMRACE